MCKTDSFPSRRLQLSGRWRRDETLSGGAHGWIGCEVETERRVELVPDSRLESCDRTCYWLAVDKVVGAGTPPSHLTLGVIRNASELACLAAAGPGL